LGNRKFVLYHGAELKDLPLILREGLRRGSFLTRSVARASLFGGAVLKVVLTQKDIGWSEPGDYVVLRRIPPEEITVYKVFPTEEVASGWGEERWSSFAPLEGSDKEYFAELGRWEGLKRLPKIE